MIWEHLNSPLLDWPCFWFCVFGISAVLRTRENKCFLFLFYYIFGERRCEFLILLSKKQKNESSFRVLEANRASYLNPIVDRKEIITKLHGRRKNNELPFVSTFLLSKTWIVY